MKWKRSDISDLDVCRAAIQFADREYGKCVFIDEILARHFKGCPHKVIWAAMERAENHRLLECGVSVRTAWLTPKGIELLQALAAV